MKIKNTNFLIAFKKLSNKFKREQLKLELKIINKKLNKLTKNKT